MKLDPIKVAQWVHIPDTLSERYVRSILVSLLEELSEEQIETRFGTKGIESINELFFLHPSMKTGPRTAPKMTIEDFKKLFDPDGKWEAEKDNFYKLPHVLKLGKVEEDFSHIESNGEDFSCGSEDYHGKREPSNHLLGFHTINGIPFYGFFACGDWECAIFYVVYHDGTQFRGYRPVEGNPWNTDNNSAYGNDAILDMENVKKRFPNIELPDGEEGEGVPSDIPFNWNLITQDIGTNIKAIE